jgi:hypothetical protein
MTPRRLFLGGMAMSVAGAIPSMANTTFPASRSATTTEGTIQLSPSGDHSGATDTVIINEALNHYPIVRLLPGNFTNNPVTPTGPWYINAPIVVPSNTRLTGDWYWQAVDTDNYSAGYLNTGGVLIIPIPDFKGPAAIQLSNDSTLQQGPQVLEGFTIEGNELTPGSGVHGILIEGAVGAGFIQGVTVHRPDGDCLHVATNQSTGYVPDDWQISFCKFSGSRNNRGVYLSELADSWFVACESSENYGDNWYCNYGTNTRFLGCKGENSATGNGWHFGGLKTGQVIELTGCTSQLNYQNGFLFDNDGGTGELGTYTLTGCRSCQDGRSHSRQTGGFASVACSSRIIGTGCVSSPDSTGAAYGGLETAKSYGMCFTGCYLAGTAGTTHDDGSNNHALLHQAPVPF